MKNKYDTQKRHFFIFDKLHFWRLSTVITLISGSSGLYAQTWVNVGSAGFSPSATVYTSIVIDGAGSPYVAFEEDTTFIDSRGTVKATVMKYNGSSWITIGGEDITGGGLYYSSLAIDGSGTPYIAFDEIDRNEGYAVMKYNDTGWVTVGGTIDSTGYGSYQSPYYQSPSLAIDRSGTPYVVCIMNGDDTDGPALVMKYNGSNWVNVGSPAFSDGNVYYPSIAIDSIGSPYVAYEDEANDGKATVMKFNGSSWITLGSAGFSSGTAQCTSIAIDRSGTPYVAYMDGSNSKATVMKYDGTSWVTVGSAGFSASGAGYTRLALDGSGTPFVSFTDQSKSGRTTVMKYNGSCWVVVGSAGFSDSGAPTPTIAIDGSGIPYVAYADMGNGGKVTVMKLDTTLHIITGISTMCTGEITTTLSDVTTGGSWSSSNTTVAIIDQGTGIVTGVSAGVATISYTVSIGSATTSVTINPCTTEEGTSLSLTISPNPNQGSFIILFSTPANEPAQITVTNILGEKIKECTINTNQETVMQLDAPAGMYFLTALTNQGIQSSKILVQ